MKMQATNGIDPGMQKSCEKIPGILMAAKYNDDPSTQKQLQARSSFQLKLIFLQENQCTPLLQRRLSQMLELNHTKQK